MIEKEGLKTEIISLFLNNLPIVFNPNLSQRKETMKRTFSIIGAGLAGCVIARKLADEGHKVVLYEKEHIGGLCRDNENYQEFTHIFHTNKKEIYEYIKQYAEIRPYIHFVMSYTNGRYYLFPPEQMTDELFNRLMVGYSLKMWGDLPSEEARNRIKHTNGSYFNDIYQGIINFRQLFSNLTKNITIIKNKIGCYHLLDGEIILTGAIDEYFDYCFGNLPYAGMKSTHCKSETRLPVGAIHFPDMNDPYVRMIDYDKYGYKGGYIGIEFPDKSAKHYPVRNELSMKLYNKYKKIADKEGIILAGRLGTFSYFDIDTTIINALEVAKCIL